MAVNSDVGGRKLPLDFLAGIYSVSRSPV